MEGAIVSVSAVWWMFLFVLSLGTAGYMAVGRRNWFLTAIAVIFAVIFMRFWYMSSTGFIVYPNQRAIVIDKSTGKVDGDPGKTIREPGIAYRPLLNVETYTYPGESNAAWCADYTPSIQGGFEVKTNICVYYNAGLVKWDEQYKLSGKTDQAGIQDYWYQRLRTKFAAAIKEFSGVELTDKRPQVEEALEAVFNNSEEGSVNPIGVPVTDVTLPNWEFTDPKVKDNFNSISIAEVNRQRFIAEQATVIEEGKVAKARAQIQIDVLTQLADGQVAALQKLGITDPQMVAWFLINRDLITYMNAHPDAQIVVNVGGQPVVAPPSGSAPVTSPQ